MEKIKTINNCAYKELKLIPNNSIDLILIDPPYNINYCEFDKKAVNWSIIIINSNRILKNSGSLVTFYGWSEVNNIISTFDNYLHKDKFYLMNWIIWDRIKGRGAKNNLMSTREDILWFVKDKNNYTYNKIPTKIIKRTGGMGRKNNNNFRAMTNVWTDVSPIVPWSKDRWFYCKDCKKAYDGSKRKDHENHEIVRHPTQKPVKLMERMINIWSNEGDIVLDFFAGSGSTGDACKNLNRNCILIEEIPEYFEIIKGRLK